MLLMLVGYLSGNLQPLQPPFWHSATTAAIFLILCNHCSHPSSILQALLVLAVSFQVSFWKSAMVHLGAMAQDHLRPSHCASKVTCSSAPVYLSIVSQFLHTLGCTIIRNSKTQVCCIQPTLTTQTCLYAHPQLHIPHQLGCCSQSTHTAQCYPNTHPHLYVARVLLPEAGSTGERLRMATFEGTSRSCSAATPRIKKALLRLTLFPVS